MAEIFSGFYPGAQSPITRRGSYSIQADFGADTVVRYSFSNISMNMRRIPLKFHTHVTYSRGFSAAKFHSDLRSYQVVMDTKSGRGRISKFDHPKNRNFSKCPNASKTWPDRFLASSWRCYMTTVFLWDFSLGQKMTIFEFAQKWPKIVKKVKFSLFLKFVRVFRIKWNLVNLMFIQRSVSLPIFAAIVEHILEIWVTEI